ncbi:conserved hypothetical protein [Vibrio crassostreae]|nr:conserved hypothetical protein [Vibrio crassostreae]CAK2287041.1 conserved hypothetical protein [Vibrio crassostreae]
MNERKTAPVGSGKVELAFLVIAVIDKVVFGLDFHWANSLQGASLNKYIFVQALSMDWAKRCSPLVSA